MDIGELLFNRRLLNQSCSTTIPHITTYSINHSKESWFFWKEGVSYRKKTNNTSIHKLLTTQQRYNPIILLQNHQNHSITFQSEKHINKIVEIVDYYKMQNKIIILLLPLNKRYLIVNYQTQNVTSNVSIDNHIKNYVLTIAKTFQNQVKSFQVIFNKTIDSKIKSILICNVLYFNNQKIYFQVNTQQIFNCPNPKYQQHQFQSIQQHHIKQQQNQNRIKLKQLQNKNKISMTIFHTQKIKQTKKNQQYQCIACKSYVILDQYQPKRIITMNKIPEIQYLVKVKMIKQIKLAEKYDLVNICDRCYCTYIEYKQINKQTQQKNIKVKEKTNQPQEIKINYSNNQIIEEENIIKNLTQKTKRTRKLSIRSQASNKNQIHNLNNRFSLKKKSLDTRQYRFSSLRNNLLYQKNKGKNSIGHKINHRNSLTQQTTLLTLNKYDPNDKQEDIGNKIKRFTRKIYSLYS